jgi:aconitate hydratase
VPEEIDGRVTIVVGDDVSTGDMAPDGAVGMSLWPNIAECAKYMFRRLDAGFHDRALAWGGGLIVGGHNYGQGSSREHAAIAPVYLGIRAVVAKSFARIHRRNLVCQGVLPLTFASEDDFDRAALGQVWRIDGARDAVADGAEALSTELEDGEPIELLLSFSPREREMLIAGGLLALIRSEAPAVAQ